MISLFIDGVAGTTGIEIEARLRGRAEFSLITLDDASRKDTGARRDALNAADIVILCLPDEAARDAVALIDNPHTRVIDASTAHRTAQGWTYGFPEISGDVASAMRISNPGCYATGFIALVAPLVKARRIGPGAPIMCNAVSGYSGGGKTMIAEFQGPNPPAWRTYALGLAHKHVPEMQVHSALSRAPLFVPAVANTYRGMIVDIPLFGADASAIRDSLTDAYSGSPVVKLCEIDGDVLPIEHAANSDRLDLFVFTNGSQTRLVAALDNLGKGASGAAIQNLNLMAGLPETTGLRL
jgi:N-acetyl-gamma-glutamyl-phosphate reductase